VVSQHAQMKHQSDLWPSGHIYDTFARYSKGDGDGPCKQIVVAYCPAAVKANGTPNPHFKAMCRISGQTPDTGIWLYMVLGEYRRDTLVTAFQVSDYKYLSNKILVDKCKPSDITAIQRFFR